MARQLISPRTRDAFRDAAVALSRTYGETCFERLHAVGIKPHVENSGRSPTTGDIVEAYYAAINWSDPNEIGPFIDVFEVIFNRVPDSIW